MEKEEQFKKIIRAFAVEDEILECVSYGSGHINDTRRVVIKSSDKETEYIIQKINKNVFKKPAELMDNYVGVTAFLRNMITKRDGKNYFLDEKGDCWRLILFVVDSMSFDAAERPEQFYDSAVAFGNFQCLIKNYPARNYQELSQYARQNTPF